MAIFKKSHLSGSIGGQPIKISEGTLIHSTDSFPSNLDEVWLYANNTSSSAVNLFIEYGGTTNPDNVFSFSLPANSSMTKVIPGLIISANDNFEALSITAYASVVDVVTVIGFVNKIIEVEDFDES